MKYKAARSNKWLVKLDSYLSGKKGTVVCKLTSGLFKEWNELKCFHIKLHLEFIPIYHNIFAKKVPF